MPTKKKKAKNEKCKEYTIMIIPRRCGSAKCYNISKKFIKEICAAVCFILIVGIAFILHSNTYRTRYTVLHNDFNELRLEKDDIEENIESLETINKYNEENMTKLRTEAENAKGKLIALNEIQSKIKVLLNDENMKMSLSRGNISDGQYSNLLNDIDNQIEVLNSISNKLEDEIAKNRKIPSILPCTGRITSYFGYRRNPFGGYTNEFHFGVDIGNSYGTKIHAAADGVVIYSGVRGGYGNLVAIDHGNGYKTYYGHNSKLLVNVGNKVKKNDVIAEMGSTGRSTGNHIHFEIRLYDEAINPFDIIKGGK